MASVEKSSLTVGAGATIIRQNPTFATARDASAGSFKYGMDGDARGSRLAAAFGCRWKYQLTALGEHVFYRTLFGFDTSDIKDIPAELSISLAVLQADGSSSFHFVQGSPLANWDNATEPATTAFTTFTGYSAAAPHEIVTYSGEVLISSLTASGNSAGGDGTINLIKLNRQACIDAAANDVLRVVVLMVQGDIDNTAATSTVDNTVMCEGIVVAATANRPQLKVLQGKVKAGRSDKKQVNDEFTIQAFEAMTEQRDVFVNKDTAKTVDQVPFQLGIKGPCSLRGRQMATDGAWEGDADAPIIKK